MSNERRSAFSRAVRAANPDEPCGYPNPGTSANCMLPQGHVGEHRNAYPPNAAVAHYSHQNALAELERARATVTELRVALELATGMMDSQRDALSQMRVSLSANPGNGETPAVIPAKPLMELRAMIEEFSNHYANDCKCKLSSGFVCIVHRGRALLARIDAESKP